MPSMCTVEVGEATLALAICGVGDTVMLLPAGNYSITYLAAFAQRLAEAGFRAVAVNCRAMDWSSLVFGLPLSALPKNSWRLSNG